MGRQLAGPVRIGKSKTWYARVTVAPKDRDRAGCVRLTRSLKTTDKATAIKRWPLVHKQLQQELDLRLGLPVTDRDQLRSRIEEVREEETFISQAADGSTQEEPYTPTEKAEAVLNVIGLEEDNPLHQEVFKAIRDGGKVTTWESLRETYAKRFLKRKGRKPSAETLLKIDRSVALFRTCCPYPSLITKTICRDLITNLEGLEQ